MDRFLQLLLKANMAECDRKSSMPLAPAWHAAVPRGWLFTIWKRQRSDRVASLDAQFKAAWDGNPHRGSDPSNLMISPSNPSYRRRSPSWSPNGMPRGRVAPLAGLFFTTTGAWRLQGSSGAPLEWRSRGRRKRSVCSLLSGTEYDVLPAARKVLASRQRVAW